MTLHPPKTLLAPLLVATLVPGCSEHEARMPAERAGSYPDVALEFANLLAKRDYAGAYAMTAESYRQGTSLEQMRALSRR